MRDLLERSFQAAVDAALPSRIIGKHLPNRAELLRYSKIAVVGAGKAGGSMAAALEAELAALDLSDRVEGLVVTRYGHAVPTQIIRVIEASHPVPDAAGTEAAMQILRFVQSLPSDALLIALTSGGGSSLLSLPVPSVSLDDLQKLTSALLGSGAPIEEMNMVRKHLSQVQGGRLAQAASCRVLNLVISDVAGDDLSAIASGPFSPDPSTFAQALQVLERWSVQAPPAVMAHLQDGVLGIHSETPKPGDQVFAKVEQRLIATAHLSLEAAARELREAGYKVAILGDTVTGEARDVAQVMAALIREILKTNQPFAAPIALLSGGECTVTLRPRTGEIPKGRGGRCSEFLLALMVALGEQLRVSALAADTDGIDGSESNAGAVLLDDSWARARAADLNPRQYLDRNDSYSFFEAIGGLVHTGPTLTNVNDYRAILINS